MILLKIVKVIIKSESGYGPVDEAYKDKLTITRDSIMYDCNPYCESDIVKTHKWKYKTNSFLFEQLFDNICEIIPRYLDSDEILYCTDIGPTDITVVYDDKSRRTEHYFCPSEYFRELFKYN